MKINLFHLFFVIKFKFSGLISKNSNFFMLTGRLSCGGDGSNSEDSSMCDGRTKNNFRSVDSKIA